MSFEVHLLTQSLTAPTRGQERHLHRVLSYLKGTLHYTLSLHPTNKRAEEKAQSPELLAFSASSWTEACRPTSTAYLILWGVPLIASCRASCAYKQADAELDSVRLALALASHTKSLLQHLDVEQLAKPANISLKTSSLHVELVTGRPLAMQLGLSRRNKHIQLRSEKGQLQLSKVHPNKNLAHSLTNTASDQRMLAKLRIDTEAAEILALSTVRGQCLASFGSSSSLEIGMVAVEPPKMDLQLRQLALPKSVYDSFERTCFESLQRNFAESLTLTSWSLPIDSLTLHSLSLTRGNSESLTLQSLSLIDENRFQRISFKEDSFEEGSLEETAKSLAHNFAERRAGTNSFSNISFQEKKPPKEAETNSFFTQSFSDRILSLSIWLRIFLLSSFQLTCAALLLGTYSLSMSFPNESLQSDELVAAYCKVSFQHQGLQQEELETAYAYSPTRARQLQQDSFQQKKLCSKSLETLSEQLCRINLDSLISQLDLVTSLSLTWFGPTRCREQLSQPTSFDRSNFEHRALPCAALLDTPRIRTQLQNRQVQSFQLPMQQLCFGLVQGGVQHRASHQPALQTSTLSTALTLTSLSFALDAWLKTSSKRAWKRSPLRKSLCRTIFVNKIFNNNFSSNIIPQQQVASGEPCFQCFGSASCSATSSLAAAFGKQRLTSTMSFHKLFGNRSLRSFR